GRFPRGLGFGAGLNPCLRGVTFSTQNRSPTHPNHSASTTRRPGVTFSTQNRSETRPNPFRVDNPTPRRHLLDTVHVSLAVTSRRRENGSAGRRAPHDVLPHDLFFGSEPEPNPPQP